MHPAISVITICFNNLAELQATCASVDEQSVPPGEHLVIDGSTNDQIVSWLTNEAQPTYRRWIHEPDKGIADAFNKGIIHAQGVILHLLNSGDVYYSSSVIAIVKEAFDKDASLMWTHSQYVQQRGGIDVVTGSAFDKNLLWKGMRTVAHPTMFVKKEVYDRHGLFNTNYKVAMDYDLLVRIRNERFVFITQPLVYFSPGGASDVHFARGLQEVKASYRKYIGTDFRLPLWQLRQQLLDQMMKTSFGKFLFKLKNKKNITTNAQQ